MAMVQVDLSEYDMLREAKNKAEKRVEELESDIKGLKDKSRVIIQTRYKIRTYSYNIQEIASRLMKKINFESYISIDDVERILQESKIDYSGTVINPPDDNSSQFIGFDDVRVMVENEYKKEMEDAIKNYKESEEEYHKLKNSVYDEARKYYEDSIKRAQGINSELKEEKEEIIKTKDAEIKALQDKIAELSRSKEEKVAELMNTINEAQAKLEELTGPKEKKGLFNKIFK